MRSKGPTTIAEASRDRCNLPVGKLNGRQVTLVAPMPAPRTFLWRRNNIALMACCCIAVAVISQGTTLRSQAAFSGPAFEVVSVRQLLGAGGPPVYIRLQGERFEARTSLREVIRFAYKQEFHSRIDAEGRFSKLLDEWVDIQAKVPDGSLPNADDIKAMTRRMLAERFQLNLQLTTETRTVFVLRRLSPDMLGPNLRPFQLPCTSRPTGLRMSDPAFLEASKTTCTLQVYNGRVRGTTENMTEFARLLTSMIQVAMWSTEEVILDETGLAGRFQMELDFDPRTRIPSVSPTGDLPSLHDALNRQLGLTIDRGPRSIPLVIVKYVEAPTVN